MNNESCLHFVAAILEQAEKDYRRALRDGNGGRIAEVERFIRSETGETITRGNGEMWIERIRGEEAARKNKKSRKKRSECLEYIDN